MTTKTQIRRMSDADLERAAASAAGANDFDRLDDLDNEMRRREIRDAEAAEYAGETRTPPSRPNR